MKSSLKIILLALTMMALSGCISNIIRKSESDRANEKLMQLQTGMNQTQVLSLMGNPYRREVYGNKEFLIYETDAYASSDMRFTPVYLEDGKVIGWGSKYYVDANTQKIDADIRIRKK